VIKNFRHKGLKKFFEGGSSAGIQSAHASRLARQLARLNHSRNINDMNVPGWRLHQLKGDLAGYWSVSVSGNWRLIFKLSKGDVFDVDYHDYH
jgi:proteic killer suppression protein